MPHQAELTEEVRTNRHPNYPIHPLILNRWSPRAMTGEPLTDEELFPLFEAARWAPSSFNAQLWKFIIARQQDQKLFEHFFNLLAPANQEWAKNAAVLAVICSRTKYEYNDKPAKTHTFDAGAAWENLALEGSARGLVVHGMAGFDHDKAREVTNLPEEYKIHAMIAIGKRAPKETLSEDNQKNEHPNTRRPLHEIVYTGTFGKEIEELKKLATQDE